MPVEAGCLIEVVHFACGGFLWFVQSREVVSLFIPERGVIMGYLFPGLYSKVSAGKGGPPFFGPLCLSVLKREDIFHVFLNSAEFNAACAVVIACAEG